MVQVIERSPAHLGVDLPAAEFLAKLDQLCELRDAPLPDDLVFGIGGRAGELLHRAG